MSTKPALEFKEAGLSEDFAQEKQSEFKALIDLSSSFTVVSMPGVGVSYFLKYLSSKDYAKFYHIDIYSLPTLNQEEFYKLLYFQLTGDQIEASFKDCQKALVDLAKTSEKIVLIFSRFDQLKQELTKEFLANLQSLTTLIPGKIVLIFTAIKPLDELVPEAISGGNLPFYSKILYFKPYSKKDLIALFSLEHNPKFHTNLEKMAELASGHIQLLHIFMNSHKQNNLLLDKFVTLQLKELISYLDYSQRKQIQKIAFNKSISEVDEYLLGVGFVKQTGSNFELFTPLLSEYIKHNLPHKLPVKEAKLFKLLRKNMGNTVSKEEIFQEVWGPSSAEDGLATDWALDALIYRLRKHPFLTSQGFIIESQKKVGYTLIQT